MILQGDRRGSSDITESIGSTWMNSEAWRTAIDGVIKSYKRSWVDGAMTDVQALKNRESDAANWKDRVPAGVKVCVANMSCGYYSPHSPSEYVKIDEVEATLHFMLDIFKVAGDKQWLHAPEKKKWEGASGGYWGGKSSYQSRYTYDEYGMNSYREYDAKYDRTSLNFFAGKGWKSKDAILAEYEYIKSIGWTKKWSAGKSWDKVQMFAENNLDGTHSYWKFNIITKTWSESIVKDSIWKGDKLKATDVDDDDFEQAELAAAEALYDSYDSKLEDLDDEVPEHPTGSCPVCGSVNLEYDDQMLNPTDTPMWWCNDCQDYHGEKDVNQSLLNVATPSNEDDDDELEVYRIKAK